MGITTHSLDIGALSPFLWVFDEREKLMELYERLTGARMHTNYIRVGGVFCDLPYKFRNDLFLFLKQFYYRIAELDLFLTENRIWRQRLVNIGVINKVQCVNYSLSGVLLRASGIRWDLRKNFPYENYNSLSFSSIIGSKGDCFDRFLVRLEELKQSTHILNLCVMMMPEGPVHGYSQKVTTSSKENIKNSMEGLIDFYKNFSSGLESPADTTYTAVESPKGEFGVHLVCNARSSVAYRCHLRSPGFFHLQAIKFLAKGVFLADIVALIGTFDIVFGEIDR